ncbi:MAG: hypothetical protein ACYCXW_10380 [Solirubrobacteraceae bacterium]
MLRAQLTRKRLLQLVALLAVIGIAWVLSLGNYEVGNPTIATGPTATSSASSSAASSSTAP